MFGMVTSAFRAHQEAKAARIRCLEVLHANRARLSQAEQDSLKRKIRRRMKYEDYTCRLPKDPKLRVRYRLTLQRVYEYTDSFGKVVYTTSDLASIFGRPVKVYR